MRNNPAIGILGAGAWGTTIAKLLSDKIPMYCYGQKRFK